MCGVYIHLTEEIEAQLEIGQQTKCQLGYTLKTGHKNSQGLRMGEINAFKSEINSS
jgi:hypothetical protein